MMFSLCELKDFVLVFYLVFLLFLSPKLSLLVCRFCLFLRVFDAWNFLLYLHFKKICSD